MLSRKVSKQKSSIHGFGIFAIEPIKKYEIIYHTIYDSLETMTLQEFEALPEGEKKKRWETYSFWKYGRVCLETDDAIYINHSKDDFNCAEVGDYGFATKDILAGTEILVDYAVWVRPGEEETDYG